MDSFSIRGVDVGNKSEQEKVGVDVNAVITYKTTYMVNEKLVTVSLTLVE